MSRDISRDISRDVSLIQARERASLNCPSSSCSSCMLFHATCHLPCTRIYTLFNHPSSHPAQLRPPLQPVLSSSSSPCCLYTWILKSFPTMGTSSNSSPTRSTMVSTLLHPCTFAPQSPPFSRARLTIYPLLNSQRTQAPPKRARSVPGVHCPISHSILGRLHLARIPLGRRGRRGPRPDRRPSAPRAPRAAHRRAGPLLPRLRARLRPRARLLRRAARAADDGLQPPCPRRLPRAREDPHGRVGRDGAAERVDRR